MNLNDLAMFLKFAIPLAALAGFYWKIASWKTSTDRSLEKIDALEKRIETQNKAIEKQNDKIEKQNDKFFEMLGEIRDNREEMRLATKKD